jgi:hypothetical protein
VTKTFKNCCAVVGAIFCALAFIGLLTTIALAVSPNVSNADPRILLPYAVFLFAVTGGLLFRIALTEADQKPLK